MSDSDDREKSSLILSKNHSLAIKRSDLIKRGLALVHELKKRQVEVLIATGDDLLTDLLHEYIQSNYFRICDFNIRKSEDVEEILKLAENGSLDILVLTMNNMLIWVDIQERMENCLQLINNIKTTYGIPVIAFSGWLDDPSIIARAKRSADFFLPLPFLFKEFGVAFLKCLRMLPRFDELHRKA